MHLIQILKPRRVDSLGENIKTSVVIEQVFRATDFVLSIQIRI